ncbi:DUF4328 domain-containing protein [Pseudonocardia sp. H11422]|uniref:DUF4328 domain-containing protein n=1 Tax=Pseudonocardia sp. H11422 TaxID=2835866 RepID=UPI001BDC7A96|nr:DUF4328 domain-containing protein [Pseudonocardia sp. H11422]
MSQPVPAPGLPPRPQPLICSRCGRQAPPDAGPFCAHCGRYLAALRWVAEPPPSAAPVVIPRWRPRYAGPPRYRMAPRWGFPVGPWHVEPPPEPVPAIVGVRAIGPTLVNVLWVTAAIALVAAGGEIWRYALLLASRTEALSASAVAASDALVVGASWFATVLGLMAGAMLVMWSVRASRAAADRAGLVASRSPRAIVLGWLVPGLNLSVPGSVMAEIEHGALDRPSGERPRPSRLVLIWWALWVSGLVLATVVLLWSLRDGVQAMADGVVLHALLDLLAAATAAVSAVLVGRLTLLLGPVRAVRREVLVAVHSPASAATPAASTSS